MTTRDPNIVHGLFCAAALVLCAGCSDERGQRSVLDKAGPPEASLEARAPVVAAQPSPPAPVDEAFPPAARPDVPRRDPAFLESGRLPGDAARPTGPGARPPFIDDNSFKAKGRYGRLLGVPDQGYTKVVLVNGRPLLDLHELGGDYLELEGAYASGETDFFVVGVNSGGIACPREFVVVSMRRGGEVRASDPFGGCADMYRAEVKGGALLLEVGDSRYKDQDEQWEFYTFRGGQVAPLIKGPSTALSRYGRLRIADGRRLIIDGRQLLDGETLTPKPVRLEFTGGLQTVKDTDYFLVAAVTGAEACPLRFVVVSLTRAGPARSSPVLGCSPFTYGGVRSAPGVRMFSDRGDSLERYVASDSKRR